MRERAWRLLVAHYQSLHPGEVPTGNYPSSVDQLEFQQLCDEETEDEPVIVADLGEETFLHFPFRTLLSLPQCSHFKHIPLITKL